MQDGIILSVLSKGNLSPDCVRILFGIGDGRVQRVRKQLPAVPLPQQQG